MMMKKTTSALAVAALLGTGAASAATFQVDENTSMGISVGIYTAYVVTTADGGTETTTFGDNGSDLVFSGEHTASNGLTTFATLDLDGFDTTEENSQFQGADDTDSDGDNPGGDVDEASVGIRGAFGEVVVGSNQGVYDQYADFADGGTVGYLNMTTFSTGDVSDVLQYSNSANALSYTLQAEIGDDGGDTSDNTSTTSLGAGADLDLGGVTLSAAYEQRANSAKDEPIYGVGASTSLGGASVTVGYEVDDNATNSIDKVSLATSYPIGGGVSLSGIVQNVSYDSTPSGEDEDSFTEVQVGAYYSITSQMGVGIETMLLDRKDDDGDFSGVGLNYSF